MQFFTLSSAFFQDILLWSCGLRFCFHSLDVWEVLYKSRFAHALLRTGRTVWVYIEQHISRDHGFRIPEG